jgi:hypothetical protein
MITITGRIERTFGERGDWLAGVLRLQDGSTAKFAGNLGGGTKEVISLVGDWVEDTKWGRQFKVIGVSVPIDLDFAGLRTWLADHPGLKGIGPQRARVLVDRFGADLETALTVEIDRVATETRIPLSTLEQLRDLWSSRQHAARASAELASFGLSFKQIERLIEKLGDQAVLRLRANPYGLQDLVPRLTFKQIDDAAKKVLVIDECDPRRLRAGITSRLRMAVWREGNTWVGVVHTRRGRAIDRCPRRIADERAGRHRDPPQPFTARGVTYGRDLARVDHRRTGRHGQDHRDCLSRRYGARVGQEREARRARRQGREATGRGGRGAGDDDSPTARVSSWDGIPAAAVESD